MRQAMLTLRFEQSSQLTATTLSIGAATASLSVSIREKSKVTLLAASFVSDGVVFVLASITSRSLVSASWRARMVCKSLTLYQS